MSNVIRNIFNKIAVVFLLAILSLMVFNHVFYVHNHITSNGTIITHAHPFQKNTDNNSPVKHQHSSLEISLLDSLELFIFGFIGISLSLLVFFLFKEYQKPYRNYYSVSPLTIEYRGPPCIN